ncbi:MAG: preprotein translocase subunit YajC, partial [Alistipes sp.]|nr:preprotein translocase subunit YajC [Alistipes sp.]
MNLLFIDGETVVETPVVENAEINTVTEVSAGEPATDAVAEQPSQPGGGWSFWVMIIAMIAIMYFFMWRPESKRRKQMEAFRKGLKKGDKVITAGGIYGTI